MDTDWIAQVDDPWVQTEVAVVEACHAGPDYVWDAQSLAGVLSFAELYTALRADRSLAAPELDVAFLDDELLREKLVHALTSMLNDEDSREQLRHAYNDVRREIEAGLAALNATPTS
ncbi:MAG: hypothetical protein AAF624_14105 [Bacteroidota bacterium]